MATFKLLLHSANKRKDETYPVSLRIIKNMRTKYFSLGLFAKKEEWTREPNVLNVTKESVLCIGNIMPEL